MSGRPVPVVVVRLDREQRFFPRGTPVRVGRDPSLELVSPAITPLSAAGLARNRDRRRRRRIRLTGLVGAVVVVAGGIVAGVLDGPGPAGAQ